jgi:hypothetical protein
MVAGERGINPTQPHVGANNYSGVICADFRLVRCFSWAPKGSPAISTYPLGFSEEWFLFGSPKSSIRIYGYSVIHVVSVHQISDSGDAGNPFTGF